MLPASSEDAGAIYRTDLACAASPPRVASRLLATTDYEAGTRAGTMLVSALRALP